MTDLRARLADALLRDWGRWADLREWSLYAADVLLSLDDIAIVDTEALSTGRHSLDDDRIEDGRYVMWFDNGIDCPWVGCKHGWIKSGKSSSAALLAAA